MSKFAKIENAELRAELETLDANIGKSIEGMARLDQLVKACEAQTADVKTLRGEIETLRKDLDESSRKLEEAKKEYRNQQLGSDPIKDKRQALEMFGMAMRQKMLLHLASRGDVSPDVVRAFDAERKMVEAYQQQRATLAPGMTSGDSLIPTITLATVWENVESVSSIPALCDLQTGLPGPLRLPVLTGRPPLRGKRSTVSTDPTQSDATFSELDFTPDEAYIFAPVDNRLLQMSAIPLGTYLLGLITDSANIGLTDWILNADGTSNYNSLTGLLKLTSDADLIQRLPSGKTKFEDLTASDLQQGKTSLFAAAQNKGSFIYSSHVSTIVDNINRLGLTPLVGDKKSEMRYPTVAPVLGAGANGTRTVMGSPEVVDAYMPTAGDSGADKAFAIYGLLSSILVGIVGQMQIAASTEYLFGRNQTCYRLVLNMDIKRKPGKYLKVYRTAAS